MECPVCNKSGIPDFRKNVVICPQCNSDLKGYILLAQTKSIHRESLTKQRTRLVILLAASIIALLGIILKPKANRIDQPVSSANYDSIIASLEADLESSRLEIERLGNEHDYINYHYVVKQGDNLSRIALLFYNDWEMYKKIEIDNQLEPQQVIYPMDTLVLKLRMNN